MADRFACPKCGTLCDYCGSILDSREATRQSWANGVALAVYQCDNEACQTTIELDGQAFPAAYTFAVGPDGKAFDPTTDGRGTPTAETDLRRN